jgi:hypothetical protein
MNLRMMRLLSVTGITAVAAIAFAGTGGFDEHLPGTPLVGWTCGVTGGGQPKWTIERDADAPSPPNVLKQSGQGTFPWCVKDGMAITDGTVEVKFKPVAGSEDQAGGLVWRWKDSNNYYIARANALEGNVSLYHSKGGRRITIKYVNAPVASSVWHTPRVEFSGTYIRVSLDGKPRIALDDARITRAGAVGV